jgi:soluble lytic murein transglycosylase-like protein
MHTPLQRAAIAFCPLIAAVLLPAAAPARADLYGFVDERGVTHFSNAPLDHRYHLLKREGKDATAPRSNLVIRNVPHSRPQRTIQVNPAHRREFASMVSVAAKLHGLDPALLHAIVTVESGYNPKALSPKGAAGLMQLTPETAKRYFVSNIWDPRQNLNGGARFLRDLLARFDNDLGLALAAYNAGEGAVIQHGNRIPPYPETRAYVPRVLQHYHLYADAYR